MDAFAHAANLFDPPKHPHRQMWEAAARPDQLTPSGTWNIWLILAGRGWGKALDLNTLIPIAADVPTDCGWKTMAEMRVGDRVFDERGESCSVTFVSPVMLGHACYEVKFSDGTVIVADADHEWLTWDHAARRAASRREGNPDPSWAARPQCQPYVFPRVRTTVEIAKTLTVPRRDGRIASNHSIPTSAALCLPDRDLPIDPYVLGIWLGDGSSTAAAITTVDPEILDEIRDAGYRVVPWQTQADRTPAYGIGGGAYQRDPVTGKMVANASLHSILKQLGVLGDKHVPQMYLRASEGQRLALLQGLMDTDGSVQPGGHCEFLVTNERLATAVYELAASLGIKPTYAVGRATLYGKDCGPRYRVSFTPYISVFRLPRKKARLHAGKAQRNRQLRRFIVDVRRTNSVPVRCIQVDSPSHLFLASRSFIPTHNTRTCVEDAVSYARCHPGHRLAVVAPTYADARDTCVEGESGLLSVLAADEVTTWNRSLGELILVNGSRFKLFSADEPDRLRGPQHHRALVDELAAWQHPEAFDQLLFGLRLGDRPQVVAATTPRPTKLIRQLVARADVHVTRGTTWDNAANLSAAALDQLKVRYEGTRLGRQELYGELLDDVPGALWSRQAIDDHRVAAPPVALTRLVVAVDPAVTSSETADDTGIVVAALGENHHVYVLADRSCHEPPAGWARAVVAAYHAHKADLVVAEVNNGGEMVELTIATVDPFVPVKTVHASRGKRTRAEPIAALYEQGMVHHVGVLSALEDELCSWTPDTGKSPDRLDALVWACTELVIEPDDANGRIWTAEDILGVELYRSISPY